MKEGFRASPLPKERQGGFHSECHSVQMSHGSIEKTQSAGLSEIAVSLEVPVLSCGYIPASVSVMREWNCR